MPWLMNRDNSFRDASFKFLSVSDENFDFKRTVKRGVRVSMTGIVCDAFLMVLASMVASIKAVSSILRLPPRLEYGNQD